MNSSYNMSREFKSINIAILTVSDTRTSTTDKSGTFLSNAEITLRPDKDLQNTKTIC